MKFENGEIKIEFHDDILSRLTIEQKKEVAKSLLWDDEILTDFVDVLMQEYISSHYNTNIYKARLRMLELMPDAAKSVIKALMQELATAKNEERRYQNWGYEMYHAWPQSEWNTRPDLEKFVCAAFPTDAEVEGKLKEVAV